MQQPLQTVTTPTRRQSPLLVLLLAFAVTYLFSSLPFGNPHIGFLKPMSLGHARLIHPHAPVLFRDSKGHAKLDNTHEWATDKQAPAIHFDWVAGPRLALLVLVFTFVARLVLTDPRAPPLAFWQCRLLRAPPLHG